MKRSCIILTLFVLLAGCSKDDNPSVGPTPVLTIANFIPLNIGNWRKFDGMEIDASGNPLPGTNYQLTSSVVGDTLVNGLNYFVVHDSSDSSGSWQLVETSYYRTSGDTLKFLMPMFDGAELVEASTVILPQPVDSSWGMFTKDTSMQGQGGTTITIHIDGTGQILGLGSLTVPYGTLANTYHVQQTTNFQMTSPDTTITYVRTQEFWAAQDVGPARFYALPSEGPGDPEPGTREELVEYHLTTP